MTNVKTCSNCQHFTQAGSYLPDSDGKPGYCWLRVTKPSLAQRIFGPSRPFFERIPAPTKSNMTCDRYNEPRKG